MHTQHLSQVWRGASVIIHSSIIQRANTKSLQTHFISSKAFEWTVDYFQPFSAHFFCQHVHVILRSLQPQQRDSMHLCLGVAACDLGWMLNE